MIGLLSFQFLLACMWLLWLIFVALLDFCFDALYSSGPPLVADVKSLTHYGEPYDGNNRFFRSTLFVAAVRACYGESCLLHGVDWMPPKVS